MKTIEESIQTDFDMYYKKQCPYLQEQQKIKRFSDSDIEEKMLLWLMGFIAGIPLLAVSKPVFISNQVDFYVWIIYSFSVLILSSLFFPHLFIRLDRLLFPMKGKNLDRTVFNDFDSEKISDSVHNMIKVKLSMDEYKYFFVNYGDSPTYGNLKNFLSERETFNAQLKAAEESKINITLTTQEISEYQEINLMK